MKGSKHQRSLFQPNSNRESLQFIELDKLLNSIIWNKKETEDKVTEPSMI